MTSPRTLRVAAALPAPFALSDYEPFTAMSTGAFGFRVLEDVTEITLKSLRADCQKVFKNNVTFGYCPVPRVKAIFFDMDATVINEESLVTLAGYVGKAVEVEAITERAMAGELDFKASLKERVATLAGLPVETLPQVAARLTLMKGIQPFTAFARELGVPCFMVSGGFMQLAGEVQRKVGFQAIHANVLETMGGKLTGRVVGEIVDAEAKKKFVLATCEKLKISAAEACAVGDGANDLPMLQAVGVAVGHKPKAVLLPHLHAMNATGNHAFLAPLLFGRDVMITRSRLMQ